MTQTQRIIIGIVVLVAVVIGIVLIVRSRTLEQPVVAPLVPTVPGAFLPQQQVPTTVPKTPTITETDSIAIKNNAFNPASIRVKKGALVTWTNFDLSPHTVKGKDFDSKVLSEGAVWSRQFMASGRYEYHCNIHPEMKGVIEVK